MLGRWTCDLRVTGFHSQILSLLRINLRQVVHMGGSRRSGRKAPKRRTNFFVLQKQIYDKLADSSDCDNTKKRSASVSFGSLTPWPGALPQSPVMGSRFALIVCPKTLAVDPPLVVHKHMPMSQSSIIGYWPQTNCRRWVTDLYHVGPTV